MITNELIEALMKKYPEVKGIIFLGADARREVTKNFIVVILKERRGKLKTLVYTGVLTFAHDSIIASKWKDFMFKPYDTQVREIENLEIQGDHIVTHIDQIWDQYGYADMSMLIETFDDTHKKITDAVFAKYVPPKGTVKPTMTSGTMIAKSPTSSFEEALEFLRKD